MDGSVRSIGFPRLNESPSEKEGKFRAIQHALDAVGLNESPSEKEGKSGVHPGPP